MPGYSLIMSLKGNFCICKIGLLIKNNHSEKNKKFFRSNSVIGGDNTVLLAVACNDDLDICQDYAFDLETMPVQKKSSRAKRLRSVIRL